MVYIFVGEIFANVCTFYLLLASHVFVHGYNAEQLGFVAQLVRTPQRIDVQGCMQVRFLPCRNGRRAYSLFATISG
jgi:hypothetical protein